MLPSISSLFCFLSFFSYTTAISFALAFFTQKAVGRRNLEQISFLVNKTAHCAKSCKITV